MPKTLVESIADQLHADMVRRNLRPGDRYMTAAEASEWLAASPVTINRAMQLLAAKDLLIRRRSRGTYVGPEFGSFDPSVGVLDVIHIVMAMDYHDCRTTDSDRFVDAVQAIRPGTVVEIHYLPESDSIHIQRLVERLRQADTVEGMVLIRVSREGQKLVADSGIPAVVFGQVFPGISLSCLSHDQECVGRLMAEFAIEGGHRQFALFAHNRWVHGDNLMVAGLTKGLSKAGVALDDLRIRSVIRDVSVIANNVRECLESEPPPTVFICRSDAYAQGVCDSLNDLATSSTLSRAPGSKFCVISGGHGIADNMDRPYRRIVSEWTLEQQMELLLKSIEEQIESDEVESHALELRQVVVPVRLETPSSPE